MSSRRNQVVAAALVVVGAVASGNLLLPREQRIGPGWSIGAFVLVGPILLASGVALLLLGPASRRPAGPAATAASSGPTGRVLIAGIAMLLVGGLPWAYLPLIFGPEREEAWGMLGTIVFLLVGLPGLAVTGIAATCMLRRRGRSAGRVQEGTP